MKLSLILLITVLILFLAFPSKNSAKQDTIKKEIQRIELKDGSVFIGTNLSENDSSIQFITISRVEVTIQKDQIKKRKIVTGQMIKGELWRKDPNQTRMLFAPTAKALKTGQGYFSAYEIFFPFIAVGVTDHFTIAGGMSLFPGADEQLLYIAPKVTALHAEKFDVAAGVLFIKVPEEGDGAGILYGVTTYGTEKAGLTLGMGFGFAGGDFADEPIFVLGGETRISKSAKFITENWIIPGADFVPVSLGVRFFGQNLAADFAFIFPAGTETEGWPLIPWIGFAYNFGHNQYKLK